MEVEFNMAVIKLEFNVANVIEREEVDELYFYLVDSLLAPVEVVVSDFGLNLFKILEVTFPFSNY